MSTYLPKHTIQKPSKRWKDELDKINEEEVIYNFSKNFKIKRKGIKEKLREMRRRRNLKEKEKYGSDDEEDEEKKLGILAVISERHFRDYEKKLEENPFLNYMDSGFGKKQKKDIKGMIKKILLYGGLPTLLVVSLGILSNKKVIPSRVKKDTKVKVSHKEELFKKNFVEKLKKYYKTMEEEINKMSEEKKKNVTETIEIKKENIIEEKKNEFDYNKRTIRRNGQKESQRELRAIAAEKRRIQNEKILLTPPSTPPRQNSSNPQQSVVTPPNKKILEIIKKRKQQGMPSNKKLNNTNNKKLNTNMLNMFNQLLKQNSKDSTNNTTDKTHIKINQSNREWSYTNENQANYYINKKDEKIYNKKTKQISNIYVYDPKGDNISPKRSGEPFEKISNFK